MNINITELLDKQKTLTDLNIIDIRSKYQYDLGHILKAKNIPQEYLLISPERYLNKNRLYYIYCQYGVSSKAVADRLNTLGYKTISINGGYNSYKMLKSI